MSIMIGGTMHEASAEVVNLVDSLHCRVAELERKLEEAQKDTEQLRQTFQHIHVRAINGDACARCGLDLRNPIHFVYGAGDVYGTPKEEEESCKST